MNKETEKNQRLFSKMSLLKKTSVALAAFFLLLIVSAAVFYRFAGGTFDKPRNEKTAFAVRESAEPLEDYGNYPNKVNILVLGVDDRKEDIGRSDTIFVIMLDTKTKQTSLLSIPRDTRTLIPGFGWDKINHAFAHGGVKLSKQTTEGLLGIPIDYYACVNFEGFYKIIDSLGGVSIDVEKRMYYEDPYDELVINLQPGVQKLDGRQAIHYVRYRDGEGDIGRISRQQKFVDALMRQAASPMILTRLPSIIGDAFGSVKTDMSLSEMVGLAKFLREAAENGLKAEMVRGTPTLIDEVDYWVPDIISLRAHIAKTQGATSDQQWLSAARAQASQYYTSIPAGAQFDKIPLWLTDGGYVANTAAQKPKDNKGKNNTAKDKDIKSNDNTAKDAGDKKTAKATPSEKDDKAKQPQEPTPPAAKDSAAAKPAETKTPAAKPAETKNPAAKPAETKTPAAEPAETKKPVAKPAEALRISVINASGSADASDKMAAELRRQGFEVAGVTTSESLSQNTIIIADSGATGKLSSLPFRYALRINNDTSKARLATVIIGKDYLR